MPGKIWSVAFGATVVAATVAAALAQSAPPVAQPPDDAPNAAMLKRGHAIFYRIGVNGCGYCHGPFANGDVAPLIRGADEGMIRASLEGVDKMQTVAKILRGDDVASIAAYLTWLGGIQLAETVLRRGAFEPASVDVYPGAMIQLAIDNTGLAAQKVVGEGNLALSLQIAARAKVATFLRVPETEGRYTVRCDCQGSMPFTINVTLSAPKAMYSPPPRGSGESKQ